VKQTSNNSNNSNTIKNKPIIQTNNKLTSPVTISSEEIDRMVKRGNEAQLMHKDWLRYNMNTYKSLIPPSGSSKKTLVLDLDETLVHSSFSPVSYVDWIIPVQIDDKICPV